MPVNNMSNLCPQHTWGITMIIISMLVTEFEVDICYMLHV